MTSNANVGTERPLPSSPAGVPVAGHGASLPNSNGQHESTPDQHSPEAEDLLRRYLSEIHSYRQLGNVALRELENRLAAISSVSPASDVPPLPRSAASPLMRPSLQLDAAGPQRSPALGDRLRELSEYLHADLSKQTPAAAPVDDAVLDTPQSHQAPLESLMRARAAGAPKSTPNAPILDRVWFEERFATMRSSIDQLAENIPTQRLDALEAQFHQLMEQLGAREAHRSMAPVEAGLKKLAAYLEDNKHWTVAQDARVRGVEERLDQLSGLVAQSHAAISATAKGLEIVARGTGPNLARATADLVLQKLEPKFHGLNPQGAIEDLSREVSHLSLQSTNFGRSTDERLKQLQTCLDESLDRLDDQARRQGEQSAGEGWKAQGGDAYHDDDDYDGKLIAAAQRAARLADGPARNIPQHGEPLRYQIPYGEFLPEDERGSSRMGLVVAAIILLLASAAMLYLNLREKANPGALSSAGVSDALPDRQNPASPASPLTTASTGAVTSIRTATAGPAGVALTNDLWVTSVTADDLVSPAQADQPATGRTAPFAALQRAAVAGLGKTDSLRQAAVDGNADAQFSVGQTYLEGNDAGHQLPVNERLSKAARWFRRAAENGHAPSQYRLATLYELGQGAPKNLEQASIWYSRAAEKGHVKAMHNLAVLSVTGGKSANYLTAAKWFAMAAERGLRDSQYNLGILYERGLGVTKDAVKAYQWFAIASRQGDANAATKRDELAANLPAPDARMAEVSVAGWTATKTDEIVNGTAPEPPVEQASRAQPVIQPRTPSAQLIQASWKTEIAAQDAIVAEAQQLLGKLGYRPGRADGILGPKTIAAIRQFERKTGLPSTGRVSQMLVAKLAFAQQ